MMERLFHVDRTWRGSPDSVRFIFDFLDWERRSRTCKVSAASFAGLAHRALAICANVSLPNIKISFTLFIDDNHLSGVFWVLDIDHRGEFDGFPLAVLPDYCHEVASDVILAADREIRGRSRSARIGVAALAKIALYLKTAKRNRFVVIPVIPNTFKCTEASGMRGEVRLGPCVCMRGVFDPFVPKVVSGLRPCNEQRDYSNGYYAIEAFSLGPAYSHRRPTTNSAGRS